MSHLKNKVARRTARLTSVLLAVLMILTVAPIIAFPASAADGSSDFMRIFHLDCGRKYFSVSEIEGIIDQLAENHYTHIQLAFGNDGFRLLLDDMSVDANGTTYSSEKVKSAITSGNQTYSFRASTASTMLSESEMNTIISYANQKDIEVIPMFNAPYHVNALLSAMENLGFSNVRKTFDSNSNYLNLESTEAVEFVKGLQKKYIEYFKGKGCKRYNFAADEYSFSNINNTLYTKFATFVNDIAAMIIEAKMTPMAYNDGFYFDSLESDVKFNNNIEICYWAEDNGRASAQTLAEKGFKIINNSNNWYYVLGDYLYQAWGSNGQWGYYDAINGINNTDVLTVKGDTSGSVTPIGSVLCCWCDYPSVSYTGYGIKATSQTNQQSVYKLIKAMADANPDYFKAEETLKTELKVVGGSVLPSKQTNGNYKVKVNANDTVELTLTNVEDGSTVTWASDNEQVATVDNGVVTFTGAAGTAKITATVSASTRATETDSYTAVFDVLNAQEIGGDAKEERRITVSVGGTATDTILNVNYSGSSYTTEDTTIATVSVTGQDAVENSAEYTSSTMYVYYVSSTWGGSWAKTAYYYKVGSEYYPLYVRYSNNRYRWGYSESDNSTNVVEISNSHSRYTQITVYSLSGTVSKPASTTVTFKGVNVGTTYVTIGDILYTINVIAEDLTDATELPIQLWITNVSIEVNGITTKGSGQFNDYNNGGYAYYVSVKALDAYGEKGVLLSQLVPSAIKDGASTSLDDRNAKYSLWKGTVLNTTTGLQKYWWKDMTSADGRIEYQYVRYYGGAWSVSADQVNWTTVTGEGSTGASSSCKEQIIAYYMQRTDVTDEVITDVVDWGNTTDKWAEDNPTQYTVLDFTVAYPDGTRVPNKYPVAGKTVYFHCNESDVTGVVLQDDKDNYYRRIGLIKGIDTEGYSIYMITVTPTSDTVTDQLTNSSTALSTSTTIEYNGTEKVIWVDSEDNLPAKFRSDDAKFSSISGKFSYSFGGTARVDGMEIYQRQGMLITYYLRPVVTKDSLTVHYRLKSDNSEFYSYNINVISGTVFKENIGLDDPWQGPLLNGDVKNDMGLIQQVSADLETIPAIGAQYRFAEYTCDSVVRSADGKDVYLYYTFNVNKSFVIDFGLPVTIKPAQIVDSLGSANITNVLVEDATYGDVKVNADFSITYTPTKILKGKENLKVTFYGTNVSTHDDGFITYFISLIPASTMYYEEDFVTPTNAGATDNGAWTLDGTRKSAEQTLSELGSRDRYGFDSAYENGLTYSMGSAWKTTVNGTTYSKNNGWPTITFTFKGTGFDIISLTDNTSGTIIVEVKNSAGYAVKTMLVNNYYSQADGLYQIPVIKAENLSYDEYTVTIIVAYSKLFDTNNRGSYTFCLDAVRIYNTLGTGSDVDAVYANDGEAAPTFTEIRDITSAADFDVNAQGVFVDGDPNAKYDTYQRLGPNHEIYLARGQAIAFNVSLEDGQHLFIGAKSPNGGAVMNINDGAKTVAINTATDMYYEITPKDGRVIILNTGDNILSLTTIKITSDPATTTQNSVEFSVDENLLVYARATAYAIMHPFAPEHFEANWTTVKLFRKSIHTLTVRTSTDVDYITVDGEKVTTFYYSVALEGWGWNRKFVKYKVFTVSLDDDAELGDYEVIAYNADGEASEPHIATLTGKVGVGKFN